MLRLRQIAFAATDLPSAEADLQGALGLRLCYRDPNVAEFGLRNALYPIGDQFLEIVSPTEPGTTAGRLLERRGGDCGYMVLFQTDALAPVEQRLDQAGIRVVFDAAGDGIRGIHLHPKDVPGAIVSVDAADDPADWPWAGSDWRLHVDTALVRAVVGMDVAVRDPVAAAVTWAHVLGIEPDDATIEVDDAVVRFVEPTAADPREGITAIDVTTSEPSLAGADRHLLGVTIRYVATPPAS
jgi:hypothetical protein